MWGALGEEDGKNPKLPQNIQITVTCLSLVTMGLDNKRAFLVFSGIFGVKF